ncbi:MAG: hypothetical protein IT210_24000 [Armatimonadetes bacterium]|nr:hypothetical protein [Armatimonadota bacterium]
MMKRTRHCLGVLRILEPALCLRCSFAWLIEVDQENGDCQQVFYCSRGDCDNWVTRPEGGNTFRHRKRPGSASL